MGSARTGAAVLLAGFALALSGCGGPGSAPAVPEVPDATVSDDAAALTDAAVPAEATVLTDAIAGAREAGSARITGSISTKTAGSDATATLSGVQQFDPAAMDLTVRSDAFETGQVVRQLLVDGSAYVQLPEFGQRWLALDLAQFAGTLSPLLSATDLSQLPPFATAGTGTVEGAAATFYTADIDLKLALRLAGLPEGSLASGGDLMEADAGTAQVRIAVDESGRLVQWQVESVLNRADGSTMMSTADLRFYDYGVATDITAPSADQILDAGSLNAPQP